MGRRYEPLSTVTAVAKLVDLLATSFGGDFKDVVTDFERRVTSWEHEAKETLSDLIEIGVVIKVLKKGGFRHHLLINTAGTTEQDTFVKQVVNVGLARKNTKPTPMEQSTMGQEEKLEGSCSWCGMCGHMAGDCRKTAERNQNQSNGRPGTVNKGKGQAGHGQVQKATLARARAKAKASLTRAMENTSLARAKERIKAKSKDHGEKGMERKDFHDMDDQNIVIKRHRLGEN